MGTENKTGFVGLTHLGIVSSICWASKFPPVVAVDTNGGTVASLASGKLPISEPKLEGLLDKNRGKITFTEDFRVLSGCRTVFVTQDIKTDEDNRCEYGSFYGLLEKATPHLSQGTRIVVMSQVSVGTSRNLKKFIKERRPDLTFELLYLVETLIIGNAVDRFLNPERIILGTESGDAMDTSDDLKARLEDFGAPLLIMKYESAELTKLAINFYLFNSVTYANTIADLCEAYGADMNEIIPALRMDKRIGEYAYIQPGLGVAGGNLERDMITLEILSKEKGLNPELVSALIHLNKRRYKWVEEKISTELFPLLKKPKVCLWGLAYKKDTASLKNAVSLKLSEDLKSLAEFTAYDPLIRSLEDKPSIKLYSDKYDAVTGAHCLVILTDPDEFKTADIKKLKKLMERPLIIDCVNLYSKRIEELKEFRYLSIGRKLGRSNDGK